MLIALALMLITLSGLLLVRPDLFGFEETEAPRRTRQHRYDQLSARAADQSPQKSLLVRIYAAAVLLLSLYYLLTYST